MSSDNDVKMNGVAETKISNHRNKRITPPAFDKTLGSLETAHEL